MPRFPLLPNLTVLRTLLLSNGDCAMVSSAAKPGLAKIPSAAKADYAEILSVASVTLTKICLLPTLTLNEMEEKAGPVQVHCCMKECILSIQLGMPAPFSSLHKTESSEHANLEG